MNDSGIEAKSKDPHPKIVDCCKAFKEITAVEDRQEC